MQGERIVLAARLLLRDLLRRPLTALMLAVVPALFVAIAMATTSPRTAEVTIALLVEAEETHPLALALFDNGVRELSQRALSIVFLGGASIAFLAAFLGFYIAYRRADSDRRLVLAGFHPAELALAKLSVLAILIVALAAYESALIAAFTDPKRLLAVALALISAGAIYGSIGLILGAIARHELQGVLTIIFLANVDVGWLQNPIYYAGATRRWIIEALPAFGSTQLAVIGAFTEAPLDTALLHTLPWALGTGLTALVIISARTRITRTVSERSWRLRVLAATYLAWLASFYAVGTYAATLPAIDPTSSLDRAIPVVPAFIWPYELTYVLPFVVPFLVRDGHRFNRTVLSIAVASLTAYAVYLAVPIAFPRPLLGDSLAERVLAAEYAWDFSPGANKLPSLHVTHAWIFFLACRGDRLGRWGDRAALVLICAITVSTLFVKQHIIIDVVAGVIWAFASWYAVARLYPRMADESAPAPVALAQALRGGPN